MTNDRVHILTFFGPFPTFGPSNELFVETFEKASMHPVHHLLRQSANVVHRPVWQHKSKMSVEFTFTMTKYMADRKRLYVI